MSGAYIEVWNSLGQRPEATGRDGCGQSAKKGTSTHQTDASQAQEEHTCLPYLPSWNPVHGELRAQVFPGVGSNFIHVAMDMIASRN